MNKLNAALLAIATLCGATAAGVADAHGYRHHSGARVGIYFGAPAYPFYRPWPYYSPYYSPYYYPPSVVVPAPASPPVYIEQGAAAAPPAAAAPAPAPSAQGSSAYWYYCADSRTYYPYVQSCASPWQQVVPQTSPPG